MTAEIKDHAIHQQGLGMSYGHPNPLLIEKHLLHLSLEVSPGSPLVGWPGRFTNVRHCEELSMVRASAI